jgi:hypothetical protein
MSGQMNARPGPIDQFKAKLKQELDDATGKKPEEDKSLAEQMPTLMDDDGDDEESTRSQEQAQQQRQSLVVQNPSQVSQVEMDQMEREFREAQELKRRGLI